jgi:hypothetical protein
MANYIVSRFADTVGDGSGLIQAVGTYAGSPTAFKLTAAPSQHITIERMLFSMRAGTINNNDVYGPAGVLTNGISVYVTDSLGNIVYYLTDPKEPIKRLAAWAHYCYDYDTWAGLAAGEDNAAARWTFGKSGLPVELLPGWSVNVLCEDDLDALTEHQFLFQGVYALGVKGSTDVGHA